MSAHQPLRKAARMGANLELALLAFIVGLIVKTILDIVFLPDMAVSDGIRKLAVQLWSLRTLEFVVLFFALVRFMYGAWRIHEQAKDPPSFPRTVWNTVLMTSVFVLFYLAGLAIRPDAHLFYMLFAGAHFVDLIWFGALVCLPGRKGLSDSVRHASRNFIELDVLTCLWWLLWFLLWSKAPLGWSAGVWAGLGMIVIGVIDLCVNRTFYDGQPCQARARTVLESKPKGAVYLAAPLFTHAEWQWNAALAAALERAGFNINLPQKLVSPMLSGSTRFDATAVFSTNVKAIEQSSCVVAVLDGSDSDSGTAWECGYAYKAGIPVIGLRTDIRGPIGEADETVNLMLAQSCKTPVNIPCANRDDREAVVHAVVEAIRSVLQDKMAKKPQER